MMTLKQLEAQFPDEDSCKRYLFQQRWPDGVVKCPRCRHDRVATLKHRPWHWQCKKCAKNGYRFSLLSKTIFQDTKYPLRTWFQVAFLMLTAKKGISAMQIQRTLGSPLVEGAGSYETFWYMAHRLRAAMQHEEFKKLTGVVEIDETYVGGDPRNRHRKKQLEFKGKKFRGKVGVIGAISRKGNVTARIIESMDTQAVGAFVRDAVADSVSLVATDDHATYKGMYWGPLRKHESVNHSTGEYVRGQVHTANLDAFWSLLKRGVMGTFHNVSKKYLPMYVNEFSFRHNHRKDPDAFGKMMSFA